MTFPLFITLQICFIYIIELTQQQEIRTILEEEKDSDPIFKVIFNKLKFLKGKLAQINHIRSLEPKTLKPAQVNKLQKLPEILKEIEKNQDFARYYKSILVDHNISNQKVDDLLKVSTLLTVGSRIKTDRYCPKEVRELYQGIDRPIFSNGCQVTASQMSDEVVRIYHLLWEYLEDSKYYSQCRDYMTYLQDIQLRKTQEGENLSFTLDASTRTPSKVESREKTLSVQLMDEVNQRMEKMEIKSEVFKIVFDSELVIKTIEHSHSQDSIGRPESIGFEKDIDSKEECSTAIPEGSSGDRYVGHEPFNAIAHPEVVWIQKSQSHEAADSFSADKSEPTAQPAKKKRNRKGKKTASVEIDNVRKISEVYEVDLVRKMSEAYTEPAAEKRHGKVKYVEKKSC